MDEPVPPVPDRAGTFVGIYIGAIPGLSVTMAVSILISFTFTWHVNEALALIAGIYMGGVYGGSRSGDPAQHSRRAGRDRLRPRRLSAGQDGARPARAIGLSTTSIGDRRLHRHRRAGGRSRRCCRKLALLFAPRDYLMLAIWGLLLVGSLSGESLAKGVFAGALGVLIGMVGLDPMTAERRFTFGSLRADRRHPLRGGDDRLLRRVRSAGPAA